MRLTFFSNFLNEHQLPLCLAWQAMDGIDFTFVALSEGDECIGRRNMNNDFDFVLREYEDNDSRRKALNHSIKDDIVIFGHMGGKEKYVKERMSLNKFSFRAGERVLKKGYFWRFFPPKAYRLYDWYTRYTNCNMYVLCASAYASYDLHLCGWPKDKCFIWGYFPASTQSDKHNYFDNGIVTLMWAARLIDWKRPFQPLCLAKWLKKQGYCFKLLIAGDGPLKQKMKDYIYDNNLSDYVNMLGELTGDETKNRMLNSDIFITTSSHKEGWGVTVNEAMEAGCAVVASASIGSAPLLIQDGNNGLLYDDSDEVDLFNKVRFLIDNPNIRKEYGQSAKEHIKTFWSPNIAAKRLLVLMESLENNLSSPFDDGPCSQSSIYKNKWYSLFKNDYII